MSAADDAKKFAHALQAIETDRDPAVLVALFAADASIDSVATQRPVEGADAIADFWRDYLALFNRIETTFTTITATDAISVLEWTSDGELSSGDPITYRGVTLLNFQSGKVRGFRTYYDSAAFVPEFEKHLKRIKR